VLLCDGFQRTHAPLSSRDEFDRRRELAMTEKARLDQDKCEHHFANVLCHGSPLPWPSQRR